MSWMNHKFTMKSLKTVGDLREWQYRGFVPAWVFLVVYTCHCARDWPFDVFGNKVKRFPLSWGLMALTHAD